MYSRSARWVPRFFTLFLVAPMLRLLIIVPMLFVVGCGGAGKPPTLPVTGTVKYRKSTIPTGALVVFHPTDPALEKRIGGKPFGKVKEDGRFTLTSYEENDGAPEGEYGVTIQWTKAGKGGFTVGEGGGGQEMLHPKYSNPQIPFTKVTIKKGDKNEFAFEVD